jgi:CDP-diglyceride synthetase
VLVGILAIPFFGLMCGRYVLPHISSQFTPTETTTGFILSALCAEICNVAGGYIAAQLAPQKPLIHAFIVGSTVVVMATYVAVLLWAREPLWYHLVTILLALPTTMVGGWLAAKHLWRPTLPEHGF